LIAICHAVLLFVANTFASWHRQPTAIKPFPGKASQEDQGE